MSDSDFIPDFLTDDLRAKIKWIQIRAKSLVNDAFAGQYQSAFKGRGMEFEEVREYFPGDDIRHIDWNVTARMERPFVKLHKDERDMTILFLVDGSGSMLFGSSEKLKNEIAAEVTALLAYGALRNHDKIGLLIFSDHVEHYLPPKKGRGHVWRVIREILAYQSKAGHTDVRVALDYLNKVVRKRAVVFLISDFQGVPLTHELRTSARRYDLIAVAIRDPRERELPSIGYVELEDGETHEKKIVNTNDPNVRNHYKAISREITQAQRDFFASSGMDTIEIDTHESYMEPILKCFIKRKGRNR